VKANRAIEEFRAANAEAEARAEVMTKRFDALDAAYSRFGELQSLSDSLDDRMTLLLDRASVVDGIEARLNSLSELEPHR